MANPTNNGRLCFDSVRTISAQALPAGVDGSNKIDWYCYVGGDAQIANTASGTLPSPSNWTTSNGTWGPNTLFITIDSALSPPGQDGELNLTGKSSLVSNNQSVKCFFDLLGTQNPSTATPKTKNWFYYWKQTSANAGTMYYGTSSKCDLSAPPDYPCYVSDGDSDSYNTPKVGQNSNTNLKHIDNFAWTARHEWRHHNQDIAWWGNGGWIPAQDPDSDVIRVWLLMQLNRR